ncbi:MAG: thermonuclease family protein [Clostridia bacterium]|nr:thermonuclease family protein [Clostridia bacterium]
MYYDNKRTFYIKQYGPTVLVSVVAVALISVGSYIYFKSTSSNNLIASHPESEVIQVAENINEEPKVQEVAAQPENTTEEKTAIETSALQEVEEEKYFENLESLVKSDLLDVASIDNSGNITLKYKSESKVVAMIGIDYKYATEETYKKIQSDLEAKQVKIAFDKVRDIDGVGQVYVYLENELYNATLLKSGLATLKSERTNVALATDLSKAQAYARDNKLGVWNK